MIVRMQPDTREKNRRELNLLMFIAAMMAVLTIVSFAMIYFRVGVVNV